MTISIVNHHVPDETHDRYDITFYDNEIHVIVTHDPSRVDLWISRIERTHRHRLHRLVVGLDVEWRPSFGRKLENPAATLQLCVNRRCLIFQLIHSPHIPESLVEFLGNGLITFVGVGIGRDVEKLKKDYDLEVLNWEDLGELAAIDRRELRNAGLKDLARELIGKVVEKPRYVTLSRWDDRCLSADQVKYASLDALLSFEIGKSLNA